MKRDVQITFRNIEPSEFIEEQVRERVSELEQFFDHIIGCRVAVEAPHKSQNKGKLYNVKIYIDVPGDTITITHNKKQNQAHEDFNVALRDAFTAAERRLRVYLRKLRDRSKGQEAAQAEIEGLAGTVGEVGEESAA